jgi:hypothetical protein
MEKKMQLNSVKEFEDFADYYQVETNGDRCWVIGKDGKVLKTGGCHGYRKYCPMLKTGKSKNILEHRLFAICFIQNPENKSEVNHRDGVKSNNSLSNLEWVTPKENTNHAVRTGLQDNSGERHGQAKLQDSEIPMIFDMRKMGLTQKAIGLHFGVSQTQISHILLGKRRSYNQRISDGT